jgi:hypothetical protein
VIAGAFLPLSVLVMGRFLFLVKFPIPAIPDFTRPLLKIAFYALFMFPTAILIRPPHRSLLPPLSLQRVVAAAFTFLGTPDIPSVRGHFGAVDSCIQTSKYAILPSSA